MIWEVLIGALLGSLGAIPFVHVNFLLQLLKGIPGSEASVAAFSVSLALSHSLFEIFPALIAISAFELSVNQNISEITEGICRIGLQALMISILALPLFYYLLPFLQLHMQAQFKFVFLAIITAYFASEREILKMAGGISVFLISGILGSVTFLRGILAEPLFPLLSGLFAIPALILKDETQEQPEDYRPASRDSYALTLLAVFASALSTLFPALTVGVLVALIMLAVGKNSQIAAAIPAIIVSKSFYDIAASAITGKTRSFAAVLTRPLREMGDFQALLVISVSAITAICIAVLIILNFKRLIEGMQNKIRSRRARRAVVAIILGTIFLGGGMQALVLASAAASIGALPILLQLRKSYLVGALILPSLLYLFGLDAIASEILFG